MTKYGSREWFEELPPQKKAKHFLKHPEQFSFSSFFLEILDVLKRGDKIFGNVNSVGFMLRLFHVTHRDFLEELFRIDRDNAHIILFRLSHNVEKALELANLKSNERIAELTKLSDVEKKHIAYNAVIQASAARW